MRLKLDLMEQSQAGINARNLLYVSFTLLVLGFLSATHLWLCFLFDYA